MKKFIIPLMALAALAACGEEQNDFEQTESQMTDQDAAAIEELGVAPEEVSRSADATPIDSASPVTRGPRGSAPGISTTAAPGVAFAYRYAFSLPNEQIADVQNEHAAACEELGVSRCRVTGMEYRVVDDDGNVAASLALSLDPRIARSFGRAASSMVADAEGELVDSEVRGTDEGAAIGASQRELARLTDDIAALERRLQTPGLSEGERMQLSAQLDRLRQSQSANEDRRDSGEAALASTPMVLQYVSGDAAPAYADSSLSGSFVQAGDLFTGTIGVFIIALGFILPWAALIGLVWFVWRRFNPASRREDDTASAGA